MAHFHSNHCFCSLKEVSCNVSTYFSTIFRPSQEARLPTFLGPTDPQNMIDVEFENFGAEHCGLSFRLVFLQIRIVLPSFDSNIKVLSKDLVHLAF